MGGRGREEALLTYFNLPPPPEQMPSSSANPSPGIWNLLFHPNSLTLWEGIRFSATTLEVPPKVLSPFTTPLPTTPSSLYYSLYSSRNTTLTFPLLPPNLHGGGEGRVNLHGGDMVGARRRGWQEEKEEE